MANSLLRFLPLLISLLCLVSYLSVRLPYDHNKTSINGDGKGYYAYLPALFIYYDLSFEFVQETEADNYPPGNQHRKVFLNPAGDGAVNKYFSGLSLLWVPFFLLAHALTLLTGGDADGYSVLYQMLIGSAASVYLFAGCRWAIKLVESFNIKPGIAGISVTLIAFGTNLFYYTVYDPSLTHSYNFTLAAGFLYQFRLFFQSGSNARLYKSAALLALLVATRPQNVIIVAAALLLIQDLPEKWKTFATTVRNYRNILAVAVIFFLPALYQLVLWQKQSGLWVVDSYTGESFDFTNPHFFEMLFSLEKGWLLYTPLAALALGGLIPLYRYSKGMTMGLMVFFIVLIFIFSSWWIWTYGHSFGQRILVDYYPVLVLLLAFLFSIRGRGLRKVLLLFAFLLSTLNLVQGYQHFHGILPTHDITAENYADSWFRLKPVANAYPDYALVQDSLHFEWKPGVEENPWSYTQPLSNKDNLEEATVTQSSDFGPAFQYQPDIVADSLNLYLMIRGRCLSGDCEDARAVVEFLRNGEQLAYHPIQMHMYMWPRKSHSMRFAVPWSEDADEVRAYVWNPGPDLFHVQQSNVTIYTFIKHP